MRLQAFFQVGTTVALLALLVPSYGLAQIDIVTGKPLESTKGPDVLSLQSGFLVPQGATRGRLSITAHLLKGWHITSLTQKPGGTPPTKITLADSKDFKLLGDFQPLAPPDKRVEPLFDNLVLETHEGDVTWQAPIEIRAGVDARKLQIAGQVKFAACTDRNCLPPRSVSFKAPLVAKLPESPSEARAQSNAAGQVGAPTARTVR